ncbi:MAG: AbgT family transporter [Bacteroidales bacterium]|nr:AbgT family transporter [Bacteroidales bacterium]
MKKHLKFINKFLVLVEKGGNALPHPATLFAIFAFIILVFSFVAYHFGWSATNPADGSIVKSVNLLSKQGIHNILTDLVVNFTSFAPLGIVIVAMLGIGVAEDSGLINATIRLIIASTPKKLITFVIIFTGVMSNIASDAGHVLIIPLAGIIFLSIGRHPVVGMAAAFAGVSGGYSANMLLGTLDPLLAGLSTEAAHIVNSAYDVNPTANYYFMSVSAVVLSFAGTWVTEKIVAPRFGKYKQDSKDKVNLDKLTEIERKGIKRVAILSVLSLILILVTVVPENSFFRGDDGSVLGSPLIKGVIALLFIFASVMGIVYGFTTKKYTSDADVMNGMSESVKTLGTYIVLVFFAAQFVAFFKMSNLGIIFAIKGANAIQSTGIGLIPLTLLFIAFSASINLLMGSASAKWAIMAPVFIPMFMLVGYSPEFTQAVYRIGDSATNIISPMLSFFPLIIAFVQKYDKKAGIGTIVATMLPYSIVFLFVWTLLMVVWIILGLPVGPGADIYYSPPV